MFGDFHPFFHGKDLVDQPIETTNYKSMAFRFQAPTSGKRPREAASNELSHEQFDTLKKRLEIILDGRPPEVKEK